jgi:hypothetical protein
MKVEISLRRRSNNFQINLLGLLWLVYCSIEIKIGHFPYFFCWFKKFTNISCFLCGITTGSKEIINGQFLKALNTNFISYPLMIYSTLLLITLPFRHWNMKLTEIPNQRYFSSIVLISALINFVI